MTLKQVLTVIICLVFAASIRAGIPTPDSAMTFYTDKDSRKWMPQHQDGSILATYTSVSADESSMRRFIQGKDGIYMLAYHVRPKLKKDDTFKIWEEILRTAELIPNPRKRE